MAEGKQSRPQRLLVVDDDRALARTIKIYLEEAGYAVEVAPDAAAARKHLAQQSYDMAIIDLGLPGEDGLSLTRSLREQGEIGLLILTGRQDATDRIVGLEIGADDYVLKPVELRELLARVRSILRRSNRANGGRRGIANKLLQFGDWTADLASRALLRGDGERVELTTAEFDLLVAFLTHPQRVLTRDQILDLTRGREAAPFDRSVDVMVGRLRKKIEVDPENPALIKTMHGIGYLFVANVVPVNPA
jgi:two-component system, OmpR family, response regulator